VQDDYAPDSVSDVPSGADSTPCAGRRATNSDRGDPRSPLWHKPNFCITKWTFKTWQRRPQGNRRRTLFGRVRSPATANRPKNDAPAPVAQQTDPRRKCLCGHHLPRKRRYCDTCRESRRRKAKARFEQRHPKRSHRVSDVSQKADSRPGDGAGRGAIVNRYRRPTHLRDRTETLHKEALIAS